MKSKNRNLDLRSSRRNFFRSIVSAEDNPFKSLLDEPVEESGEKVQLLSVDGKVVEIDRAYLKPVPETPQREDPREAIEGKKFVMVIDLSRCKNLKNCQAACNKMHFVSGGQNYIKIYSMKDAEDTSPYWQPTTCMHCDEPPCVKVCPVDATFKRSDGIVHIDNERCIGCRFCMAACPYSTRIFNWDEPEIPEYAANSKVQLPRKGVVGKCDFCPLEVKKGKLPHCVDACPNGVFYFGDMNEDVVTNGSETVRFSHLIRDKAGYRLMEELGAHPRVYYLPPVNRLFPYEEGLENLNQKDG